MKPGETKTFYFRVYPDIAFPDFTPRINGHMARRGEWGAGELDLYPGNCREKCINLYLAKYTEPQLPRKRRIQIWKKGKHIAVENVVLEEGALDILKKQGYVQ